MRVPRSKLALDRGECKTAQRTRQGRVRVSRAWSCGVGVGCLLSGGEVVGSEHDGDLCCGEDVGFDEPYFAGPEGVDEASGYVFVCGVAVVDVGVFDVTLGGWCGAAHGPSGGGEFVEDAGLYSGFGGSVKYVDGECSCGVDCCGVGER